MTDVERVDAYLAALPDGPRGALESLRATIRAAAPEAEETIAYGMPAFRINGRFLVSYAAYKRHCSLFPASQAVLEACGPELEGHVAGRGTIQFRAEAPLSAELVRKIVKVRLKERATPAEG
jgi:uncharacterized protein YdhG (YjbR/CyaY superfamily)